MLKLNCECKRAYHQGCLKRHLDAQGTPDKYACSVCFVNVHAAIDLLSDEHLPFVEEESPPISLRECLERDALDQHCTGCGQIFHEADQDDLFVLGCSKASSGFTRLKSDHSQCGSTAVFHRGCVQQKEGSKGCQPCEKCGCSYLEGFFDYTETISITARSAESDDAAYDDGIADCATDPDGDPSVQDQSESSQPSSCTEDQGYESDTDGIKSTASSVKKSSQFLASKEKEKESNSLLPDPNYRDKRMREATEEVINDEMLRLEKVFNEEVPKLKMSANASHLRPLLAGLIPELKKHRPYCLNATDKGWIIDLVNYFYNYRNNLALTILAKYIQDVLDCKNNDWEEVLKALRDRAKDHLKLSGCSSFMKSNDPRYTPLLIN